MGPRHQDRNRRKTDPENSLNAPSSFHPPDNHQKNGITFSMINQVGVLQQNHPESGHSKGTRPILGEAGLDDKRLGEMDFRIRPITKIGLSEGYGDGTILLMAVELG